MSVATHLGIRLADYDRRIRTFIPRYEQMLDAAARALRQLVPHPRVLLDLGVGTGALALRCVPGRGRVRLVGIDGDPGMLAASARRLRDLAPRVTIDLVRGDFRRLPLPAADAIVASLALHHVRTPRGKQAFYRRCWRALSAGGVLITADCFPAADAPLAARQRAAWLAHLERTYSPRESDRFLAAWAREDVYFPLEQELVMLRAAGFRATVPWRHGAFGVIAARKTGMRSHRSPQ